VTPSQVVGYKNVKKYTVNDINSTLSLKLPSDGDSSRNIFGINSPRENNPNHPLNTETPMAIDNQPLSPPTTEELVPLTAPWRNDNLFPPQVGLSLGKKNHYIRFR